jgi:hypothetical protein
MSSDIQYEDKRNTFAYSLATACMHTYLCNEIAPSARIFAAVIHAIRSFKTHYGAEPTLHLMADALANNPILRSLRNTEVLTCKLCSQSATETATSAQTHTILTLILHFQFNHEKWVGLAGDVAAGRTLSWLKSMILLPTRHELEAMVTVGNVTTTDTLQLYRDVLNEFPEH